MSSSYNTPVIHQNTYSSSRSSSKSSGSYSTSSTPRASDMTSSSSRHSSSSQQYRSAKADGYTVDVSHRSKTTVINHKCPNPSYDEPTSGQAYDNSKRYGSSDSKHYK